MYFKLVIPPAVEPVTLAQVKDALGYYCTDDDDKVQDYISAATDYAQDYQKKRVYITQTWELYLDEFPDTDRIELPKLPAQRVEFIKYKDSTGAETTLSSSDYLLSKQGYIVPGYNKIWPSFTPYPVDPITIRFVAGYDPKPAEDVEGEALGTGDGEETEFMLDNIPIEPDSETIYVDSQETTAYLIDYETGEIIFTAAPAESAAITADYTKAADLRYNVPKKIKQAIILYCKHLDYVDVNSRDGVAEDLLQAAERLLYMDRAW